MLEGYSQYCSKNHVVPFCAPSVSAIFQTLCLSCAVETYRCGSATLELVADQEPAILFYEDQVVIFPLHSRFVSSLVSAIVL